MEELVFSMDSPECQSCKFYDDCNNKRKVMCCCMPLKYLSEGSVNTMMSAINPLAINHDCREIKIDNMNYSIDLEDIKKEIEKALCPFLQGGA